jgi:4-alpha-glucanotransferase
VTRPSPLPGPLRELADHYGVALTYRDVGARRVQVSEAVVVGVLGALGAPADGSAQIADSLAQARVTAATTLLEPVLVVGRDRTARTRLGALPPTERASATVEIVDEEGGSDVLPLREVARHRAGGSLEMVWLGVGPLAPGTYRLVVETHRRRLEAMLLVRPPKPALPARAFGVYATAWGLRSASDWGVGSTTELARLGAVAASQGASYLATSPLYAMDYASEVSPYRPLSRLAWSELYLDPATLPERGVAGPPFDEARCASLHSSPLVDYEQVDLTKHRVLEGYAAVVDRGPRAKAFASFLTEHPDVRAYAAFRAEREAVAPLQRKGAQRFHEYVQFAMDQALGALQGLYLDLPVGVHPAGFDVAAFGAHFVTGASLGAPPDAFFAEGQTWGVPPLHPLRSRAHGHGYWRAVVEHAFRHAAVLRIDHVMGLERCYLVPDGHEPTDGTYVRYPADELRAVLALEAHRRGAVVVGEDLGTVPAQTRRAMHRDGMLRSSVYQFEAAPDRPSPGVPPDSVASFGTHDLPRFAAFVSDADVSPDVGAAGLRLRRRWRGALERLATPGLPGAAYEGLLSWLASCEAAIALVDLGDLVGDAEQENRPGNVADPGNWRHRLPRTLEELERSPTLRQRLAVVRAGRGGEGS